MSCNKCESLGDMKEYFKSNCVCDILIAHGNCENCLSYGECLREPEYIFESEYIKKCLTCPISSNIFIDPVIAIDGHTYEREYIELWFSKSNNSPMTGEFLYTKQLYPNYIIKSIIKNSKKLCKQD
jgi:hypothetical protein